MRRKRSRWGAAAAVIPVVLAAKGCALLLDYNDYQDPAATTGTGGGSGSGGSGSGAAAACEEPGQQEECTDYSGPPMTRGVGECKAATRTCGDDGTFGLCTGEVVPAPERAGNDKDEDCDGSLCSSPAWSKRLGDAQDQELLAMSAHEQAGSGFLMGGAFRGTLALGNQTLENAYGHDHSFVTSLAQEGSFQWSYHGGSDTILERVYDIAPPIPLPVIAGYRRDIGVSGPEVGFAMVLDSIGVPLATQTFSTSEGSRATAVAGDTHGHTYVAGDFAGILILDPPPPINVGYFSQPQGERDLFVAKYGATLTSPLWLRSIATSGSEKVRAMEVYVVPPPDDTESVLLTGQYRGVPDAVDPNFPYAGGQSDPFVMKFNGEGDLLWARGFTNIDDNGSGTGNALALDVLGNVYVAGKMTGMTRFSEQPEHLIDSAGVSDAFVVMLDLDGNIGWVRRFGEKGRTNEATGIAVDDEYVYVTGSFQGTLDLDDPATGTETLTAESDVDLFLLKLDRQNGKVVCSARFAQGGGGPNAQVQVRVVAKGSGQVTLAGSWGSSPLDFGSGPLAPVGGLDVFLAKFNETLVQ